MIRRVWNVLVCLVFVLGAAGAARAETDAGQILQNGVTWVNQFGGSFDKIDLDNGRVYLGVGGSILSLNVSDSGDPGKPSDAQMSPSANHAIHDLEVVGAKAYAATEGGLAIFDVTNPAQMQVITQYITGEPAIALDVVGSTVYLVDEVTRLMIFNVSDPANPQLLGSADLNYAVPRDIAVANGQAYITVYDGLWRVNVSNPSAIPAVTDNNKLAGYGQTGQVKLSGNVVYFLSADYQLTSVATNTENLVVLDHLNAEPAGCFSTPAGLYIQGATAYIAWGNCGVQKVDVSIPANLALYAQGYDPAKDETYGVVSDGTSVYASFAHTGLHVLNPASLAHKHSYSPDIASVHDGAQDEKTLYISDWAGISVWDISDPASPVYLNHRKQLSVAVDHLIVHTVNNTHWLFGTDTNRDVVAIPLGSIDQFDAAQVYTYNATAPAYDLTALGNRLYISLQDGSTGGVEILDITNPAAITSKQVIPINGSSSWGLRVESRRNGLNFNRFVYVASGQKGLCVIDLKDESHPVLQEPCIEEGRGNAMDVEVKSIRGTFGSLPPVLYITFAWNPPTAPNAKKVIAYDLASGTITKKLSLESNPRALALSQDYLYVDDSSFGVSVYKIQDPRSPVYAGRITLPGEGGQVRAGISPNSLLRFDNQGGVSIIAVLEDVYLPVMIH